MSFTPISGKAVNFKIATTSYSVGSWEGTLAHDVLEANVGSDAGWKRRLTGLSSFDGTISMPLDTAAVIYSVTGFSDGSKISQAVFDVGNGTSTITCDIVIGGVDITAPVDGVVTCKVNFSSSGAVTLA